MYLVDSCGWLEYFRDGPLAREYEKYLRRPELVVVPIIVFYEVYKKIKKETDEEKAILAAAQMQTGRIVYLDENLALTAADLSLEFSLPMADAFVYATARLEKAKLISSDRHFKGLPGVEFIKK